MKRTLFALLSLTLIVVFGLIVNNKLSESTNEIAVLRNQHESFLKNSPFKESLKLTKSERKAKGIPPNKYFERQWELTFDPNTGKPETQKLFELQEKLYNQRLFSKVPGENANSWVERGPDNVGGRTRAIMYDPNDGANGYKRVFAGGVGGGLWVNNDITDANSAWAEVGIPKNLAISAITYDPNNTNIFYLGTGESYVAGDVNGNGVWKSTNGGTSWTHIFGGVSGETVIAPGDNFGGNARVTVNSPGSIAGDYYGIKAGFGPTLTAMTGDLVLADDGTAAPNEACNDLINGIDIAGNIAVLYRGACEFGLKVLKAEEAGAVAVIVVNNVAGDPIVMGEGTDGASVTIPSLMLSQADGQILVDQLGGGVNVSISGVTSYGGYLTTPGIQHVNDIKVRDIGSGNSEVYIAAGSSAFRNFPGGVTSSLMGTQDFGLYKSTDNGSNWSKIDLASPGGYDYQPNDIEIATDNTIWLATTQDVFNDQGGEILSSTDGISFTLKHTITNGKRTQIAVSGANPNTVYVLAESGGANGVEIIHTDDAFATSTSLPLPDDADNGIPSTDFTRGQAFYDLMLEVDPTNDAIVYVGGIDLFRSSDTGDTWDQISRWSTINSNLNTLLVSPVHADQHILVFNPDNANQGLFGTDGGVFYGSDLSAASSSVSAISARNKNYNTLQFYKGAIGQEEGSEKLLAGAQDNGSQLINNAASGINGSNEIQGGDGGYCFIDRDNEFMITSYVYNNYTYHNYSTGTQVYNIDSDGDSGDFINTATLDSNVNFLYTNGSSGSTYKVNAYELDTGSATKSTFDDPLLDGAPTAFKALASTAFVRKLLVGTENGKLFSVSVNSFGDSWTEITGPSFVGSISCIETGATENDIYVTFYNYGVANVFYSADAGSTWQDKENDLPDLPVRAILTNPLNSAEVILATDLGVWGTNNFNDANPNWHQSYNGMKDVKVTSFDLRTSDNMVLASTYGRGMFTGQFTAAASTLSVYQFAKAELINIYPTVSSGEFKISPMNDVREGNLAVFDINGREIYKSKIKFDTSREQNISLNASSGIYFVKFYSENLISTHKIIIE